MIFLSSGIVKKINSLVDWQLCSENWAYVVYTEGTSHHEVFSEYNEGDRIDTKFLQFPSDYFVEVISKEFTFSAKPFRVTGQVFALTMLFEGHAEIRNDTIYIVGKYTLPQWYKGLLGFWNSLVIGIASLALIVSVPFSIVYIWEERDFLLGLLLTQGVFLASIIMCVIMLSFVKLLGIQISLWNHLAGRTLQKFLHETTVSKQIQGRSTPNS